jgi:hypothetical protein
LALKLSTTDRAALLFSLLGILITYLIAVRIYESMAHIEDETAYIWQAQAIAQGKLTLDSPDHAKSFLVPFVVDHNGQRFGKYPLGWPVLLAVGERLGARSLVNSILAGLAIWLTYILGKRVFTETVGLLAAGLTLVSPFFLMNSMSLLSHPFGLVLSLSFALTWLDAWDAERLKTRPDYWPWLAAITAAVSLGTLILTRPLTAVGLILPFSLHAAYLLVHSGWVVRKRLVVFGLIVLAFLGLHFLWQYAVTGDARLNPYTLWWEYDKVGFGPGYGRKEVGHTLEQARINTRFSLRVGWNDLFGWGRYTWILPLVGLLATLRYRLWRGVLLGSVYPSLVLVYLAYWIGSSLFGPRYFYEGLFSLTLLSGAAIAWLAGWPVQPGAAWRSYTGWRRLQPLLVTAALALLICMNLLFYTPMRVGGMYGLYGISRARLAPFLTPEAQQLTPALVIVHPNHWTEYGALLELQTPFLDTPWLFIYSRGPFADAALAADYPERTLLHYYPDEPYRFYLSPQSD